MKQLVPWFLDAAFLTASLMMLIKPLAYKKLVIAMNGPHWENASLWTFRVLGAVLLVFAACGLVSLLFPSLMGGLLQ